LQVKYISNKIDCIYKWRKRLRCGQFIFYTSGLNCVICIEISALFFSSTVFFCGRGSLFLTFELKRRHFISYRKAFRRHKNTRENWSLFCFMSPSKRNVGSPSFLFSLLALLYALQTSKPVRHQSTAHPYMLCSLKLAPHFPSALVNIMTIADCLLSYV